ncbi:4859_t:CDS:1 [Paraglomus occultum]|uniref:4859_t:CDS:1 n=1 Tax=Paraglomus occultum TaxID=144539 RepID=A0A9N9FSC2_9GLOM|nr:4859_t:CDS:1 [Paraglomus occultum]
MAPSLPKELFKIIFDEHEDDLFTLHSCILVNRNWCIVALQYLWARPFTLLLSSQKAGHVQSIENLITTFIECFTDVDSLTHSPQLRKKNNKKFPLDYSFYLEEFRFKEIQVLGWYTKFNSTDIQAMIAHLAVAYCPNLTTLSLTSHSPYRADFHIDEKWTLPCLQNLSLSLILDNSVFSTLSRAAHNLKSLSVKGPGGYNFAEQVPHYGLQNLIQSQHQLKTITVKIVITNMSSLFKLLESQSNSLQSIVLEDCRFYQDDLDIKLIKFHQLASICIKQSWILEGGLKSIIEADLPKLRQLKFENTGIYESDWILLQNKYQDQLVIITSSNFI